MIKEELQTQIKVVAEARHKITELREEKNIALSMWENENKELLRSLDIMTEEVSVVEAWLRTLTLKAYNETGSKAPAVGVSVKMFEVLNYDADKAKEWALEHRVVLSLDKKSFEDFAKATPLEFVSITEEPRAQIATNLPVE
ncbi:hypothetical protein LCGC14_0366010 [marine sediment metagenome]|uniref:Uncharacterized protein n=1 Tax=marine sediment metagenome TaxID=412755 RepID=A0A0F9TCP9_9ZZZZ